MQILRFDTWEELLNFQDHQGTIINSVEEYSPLNVTTVCLKHFEQRIYHKVADDVFISLGPAELVSCMLLLTAKKIAFEDSFQYGCHLVSRQYDGCGY